MAVAWRYWFIRVLFLLIILLVVSGTYYMSSAEERGQCYDNEQLDQSRPVLHMTYFHGQCIVLYKDFGSGRFKRTVFLPPTQDTRNLPPVLTPLPIVTETTTVTD